MKKHNLRRIVAVTSIGTTETYDNVPWVFTVMRWAFLSESFKDKNAQEKALQESGLDYTIVRPSRLLYGPATGKIDIDPTNKVMARQITRADVAALVLRLAGNSEYTQQAISVNNAA